MPNPQQETSASRSSTTTSVPDLLAYAKDYVSAHNYSQGETHSSVCASWHTACLVSRMAEALERATVANECYSHSLAAACREIHALRATREPEGANTAQECTAAP